MTGDDDEIIIRRQKVPNHDLVGEIDSTNALFHGLLMLLPTVIADTPTNNLRNSLVTLTS